MVYSETIVLSNMACKKEWAPLETAMGPPAFRPA